MATYGVFGSPTYAVTLSGLDEIMSVLPDNDVNQIAAQDVRNVSYTLWQQIASASNATTFYYTNPELSTIAVGGIPVGTSFSNIDLQSLFDRMFYPFQSVSINVTANPSSFEKGFGAGADVDSTITVTITRKTNPVVSANINLPRNSVTTQIPTIPTAYNQTATTTYVGKVQSKTSTTFTLTVSDLLGGTGDATNVDTVTVTWYVRRYYGKMNLNTTFGNDFDISKATAGQLSTLSASIDSNLVRSLANSSTSSLRNSTISNFDGAGQHLIMAWPSTDGDPNRFIVGVLEANVFTKVKTFNFQNSLGHSENYDVWMSNTKQGSAINLQIF